MGEEFDPKADQVERDQHEMLLNALPLNMFDMFVIVALRVTQSPPKVWSAR